jgi:hypothetical protein
MMLTQVRGLEAAFNFKLIATHIPGKINTVADRLSRVVLDDNYRVKDEIIRIINECFMRITIDRFATRQNRVTKLFNSYLYEEDCTGIDAFSQNDYPEHINYMFPPISLAGRVI